MDNNFDYSIEMKFKKRFNDHYDGFFPFISINWKKILIIIFCALFYAFGQVQFLLKAASVSDGVEAISTSLAYVLPYLKPFLTILYLCLNIPFIVWFWKKVKKPFMVSTLIFLCCNALFGFIFGLEPVDQFISQKVIVIMKDGWLPIDSVDGVIGKSGTTKYVDSGWPVFVYIILTVACCSPTSAIVWKLGSSTGGTDLIAHYISSKLKKPVGNFLVVTGTGMATIGIIFLYICKNTLPASFADKINGFEYILCPQTFGTYLYILLNGFVINLIYPKYNKVKMRIDTREPEKVIAFLKSINFWHPYKIETSVSGYNKENVYSIESVVLLLESNDVANKIKSVIPEVWISISPVSKIYGRFNYSKID